MCWRRRWLSFNAISTRDQVARLESWQGDRPISSTGRRWRSISAGSGKRALAGIAALGEFGDRWPGRCGGEGRAALYGSAEQPKPTHGVSRGQFDIRPDGAFVASRVQGRRLTEDICHDDVLCRVYLRPERCEVAAVVGDGCMSLPAGQAASDPGAENAAFERALSFCVMGAWTA